jgi:hypothetical protein
MVPGDGYAVASRAAGPVAAGDSEPAPGRLSGLLIHNHPFKCDAQRKRPGFAADRLELVIAFEL